ncbi:MAG TPA: DUF1552 domain-containing protein [Lacipirellulaceae bacterium]|nr:DUF1552 domain-containing protein [Lacipirellulaceae bacterium]
MSTAPDRQKIAQRQANFSRRGFLRGLGVTVALPALESLRPARALAALEAAGPVAVTATGAPLRTAFLYFPNGAIPRSFWPKTEGRDFELTPTLQPLAPLRDAIQVLGGLDHRNAEAGPDGAGDHARAGGTFLTGVRVRKTATDIQAGISIDQEIARRFGHVTRLPSLELSCEPGRRTGSCDSGYSCAYQFNLSWSSPTTPMTPEANPRLVFERLFGAGGPGERAASLQRRLAQQRSVLDFVLDDAHAMQRRLGQRDAAKLDQYLTGVRDIEARIQQAEQFGPASDPGIEAPSGIPDKYEAHMTLMYDMLALALQTDSTRVATLLLAHDGSNRSFDHIGIFEGHHDLTHHQEREDWVAKVEEIDLWYVRQFARFLEQLRGMEDVDGRSVLDNSMIVYGGGNSDANRHTHTNLPIVLAGGGGGTLTPGRFVRHGGVPASNLFLSLAERLGVADLPTFGDSTDRLDDV